MGERPLAHMTRVRVLELCMYPWQLKVSQSEALCVLKLKESNSELKG